MSLLIEPEILATLLNDEQVIILDARFSLANRREGQALFDQGHIPGAIYADLESDLSGDICPGKTGRHPLPAQDQFTDTLRTWGVTEHSLVVVYDDGGHAMAARAWWLLRWAGVNCVCVLHGGLKAWLAARYPVTTESFSRVQSTLLPAFSSMPTVTAEKLHKELGSDSMVCIDARSQERFNGEVEPLDAKAGHIPGALCHPFVKNMDEQGRFLSPEQLRAQFNALIPKGSTPVFYCGSGVTACHNILAMEYAGLNNAVLYPGSWSEWITEPGRPVANS